MFVKQVMVIRKEILKMEMGSFWYTILPIYEVTTTNGLFILR